MRAMLSGKVWLVLRQKRWAHDIPHGNHLGKQNVLYSGHRTIARKMSQNGRNVAAEEKPLSKTSNAQALLPMYMLLTNPEERPCMMAGRPTPIGMAPQTSNRSTHYPERHAKKRRPKATLSVRWCRRRDSNPHTRKSGHKHLKLACLPFHHSDEYAVEKQRWIVYRNLMTLPSPNFSRR